MASRTPVLDPIVIKDPGGQDLVRVDGSMHRSIHPTLLPDTVLWHRRRVGSAAVVPDSSAVPEYA